MTIAGAEGADSQDPGHDQDHLWRVLKHDVACRVGPSPSALIAADLRFSETVEFRGNTSDNGEWLAVAPDGYSLRRDRGPFGSRPMPRIEDYCWVPSNLVSPHGSDDERESFLRAAADLAFSETTPYDSDDFLRLLSQFVAWKDVVGSSPVLQMKELDLLGSALRTSEIAASYQLWDDGYRGYGRHRDDPLTLNWLYLQGDRISSGEEGGLDVGYEQYDALYREFADHPEAEELLWGVAQQRAPTSFEHCVIVCVWEDILARWARYWQAYPNGQYVTEAVSYSIETVARFEEFYWKDCKTTGRRLPNPGVETLRELMVATDVIDTPEAAALRERLNSALEAIEACLAGL